MTASRIVAWLDDSSDAPERVDVTIPLGDYEISGAIDQRGRDLENIQATALFGQTTLERLPLTPETVVIAELEPR